MKQVCERNKKMCPRNRRCVKGVCVIDHETIPIPWKFIWTVCVLIALVSFKQ